MKNLFKLSLIAALFFVISTASAQKFGHIDTQQLIQVMPEMKAAQETMQKYAKDLQDIQAGLEKEYQGKLVDYTSKKDSISDVKRQALETELQGLMQRIQTNGQVSQQQFQQKQQETMKPIIDKMRATIETVAKEQGLIYVFDVQPGTNILYKSNDSIDLLPLIKKKLGLL